MSEDYGGLVTRLRSPAMVFYEYKVDDGALPREAADALASLCERVEALTAETCDLTGRLDIARQERGIAEAQVEALERERDEWRDAAQSSVSEQERGEWQRERDAMTDALATAQQEQLEADVMSLSHPVCQQLLADKRRAQTERDDLADLILAYATIEMAPALISAARMYAKGQP